MVFTLQYLFRSRFVSSCTSARSLCFVVMSFERDVNKRCSANRTAATTKDIEAWCYGRQMSTHKNCNDAYAVPWTDIFIWYVDAFVSSR